MTHSELLRRRRRGATRRQRKAEAARLAPARARADQARWEREVAALFDDECFAEVKEQIDTWAHRHGEGHEVMRLRGLLRFLVGP